jgi:hypothetical protein
MTALARKRAPVILLTRYEAARAPASAHHG